VKTIRALETTFFLGPMAKRRFGDYF